MTKGVTFSGWREGEPIGLGEVLEALGSYPVDSMWTLKGLDCAPSRTCEALLQEAEERQVPDVRLRDLLRDDPQLLEGEIAGLAGSPQQPSRW